MRLVDLRLGAKAICPVSVTRLTDDGPIEIAALAKPLRRDDRLGLSDVDLLARSLVCVEDPSQPFGTMEEIYTVLTAREIGDLVAQVRKRQLETSPSLDSMSAKEFEKILDDLEEEDKRDLLLSFRAVYAKDLFAAYGIPSFDLTDGQVIYFVGLRRAHNKREEARIEAEKEARR